MTAPAFQPIHTLAADIAARRLSPVDLVDECLSRIERLEPKLHAFVSVNRANARLAAEAAHKAIVPAMPWDRSTAFPSPSRTSWRSRARWSWAAARHGKHRKATRTATLMRKLLAAGMINIGKTHTVEFAYGAWGTNQHLGTPWNPWDSSTHRAPGGSSSGSGVAVAARLAPCAIGTDTGGSVRVPAAWNGVTGLKTTIGRVSTFGVLPLSHTLDTPGPITRDVEDAALLLTVLQGTDAHDPQTAGVREVDPFRDLRRGVKGLRLGRLSKDQSAGIDPEILSAYDHSVEFLAGLGAEIVDLALPIDILDLGTATAKIISAESYAMLAGLVDDNAQPLDQDVRPRVRAGAAISSKDYLQLLAQRQLMKIDFAAAIENLDALLTPTLTTPAMPIATIDQTGSPAMFTRWVNFLDLCAVAVPNGFTSDGLPSSLQVVCRAYQEPLALRIGYAYQIAHDWHMRVPPMAA